ncbi:MAG TPA: hypothetical protein VJ417_12190, partial [Candidatus Glassbacteria bacterium]|nr:hypothetical protein [Candidatus Glassbacteria bacterium]
MNITFFLSLALVVLLTACEAKPNPADLVLVNGKIFTCDRLNPQVEAVAVTGNRISAAGTNGEIERYVHEGVTRVIDL